MPARSASEGLVAADASGGLGRRSGGRRVSGGRGGRRARGKAAEEASGFSCDQNTPEVGVT